MTSVREIYASMISAREGRVQPVAARRGFLIHPRSCRCWFLSLILIAPIPAVRAQTNALVSPPVGEPIYQAADVPTVLPLEQRIGQLVVGMGSSQYAERIRSRGALADLLETEGPPAVAVLKRDPYTDNPDPEIAMHVRELLAAARPPARLDPAALDQLLASGLSDRTLPRVRDGGKDVAHRRLHDHLRGQVGVDFLYSLKPGDVLPEACRLLAIQKEDYYRALLARTIAGVLERAVLPIGAMLPADLSGIAYMNRDETGGRLVRALADSDCAELRLMGLRICAYGLIPPPPKMLEQRLADRNGAVAAEAERLRGLLAEDKAASDNEKCARWIAGCLEALSQKDDRLAQLGARNALDLLVDRYAIELYRAHRAAPSGLGRDVIAEVLSSTVVGRLLFIRQKQDRLIRQEVFPGDSELGRLWAYDVQLTGLAGLAETQLPAVTPLVRRNLSILGLHGEPHTFGRVNNAQEAWQIAVKAGMSDLAPILKYRLSVLPPSSQSTLQGLETALAEAKGEKLDGPSADSWYARCAANLDAPDLEVRAGAVGALSVSGLGGAQAMVARRKRGDWQDKAFGDYLDSLILFHPYSKFLVDKTEYGRQLGESLDRMQRAVAQLPKLDKEGRAQEAVPIPVLLWAYIHQNDCKIMNPVGKYLAQHLTPIYSPLILAWLDRNSRMSIFLVEVRAREAEAAVLRRLRQRDRIWGYSYDHDLFHYVVVYELADAIPFLEHYVKTNSNWPAQGVHTLAGLEGARYCWEGEKRSGRPNPLALPTIREIARTCGTKHLVDKYTKIFLDEMAAPKK